MAWGTGQNRHRIHPGDTVFLLRQGSRGRGIVATGHTTSGVERDPRVDPSSRVGNYVDVAWTLVLPLVDMLPTEELMARVPGVPWRYLFQSGFTAPPGPAEDLVRLWEDHVGSLGE
jgi:hypothetical protein